MKKALLFTLSLSLFSYQLASAESDSLPDPLAAGWQGKPVCERLHEDSLQRVLRCSFAPGVGHDAHFHAPHFGYALSGGKMRIIDKQKTREVELATGSSYSSDGVAQHQVLNIGSSEVIYLIVENKTANTPPPTVD